MASRYRNARSLLSLLIAFSSAQSVAQVDPFWLRGVKIRLEDKSDF
jgi:hypothetical protein